MATTTLTPRQQVISDLMAAGKTPPEIAKQLKITDNAVYQQLRRMRNASGAKPKAKTRKATAKRSTRSRPSAGTRAVTAAARRTTAPTSKTELRDMTPLQAIRARKDALESTLKDSEKTMNEARKSADRAAEEHTKLVASRAEELKQLELAERALKGTLPKAASRSRARAANGTGKPEDAAAAKPAADQQETAPLSAPNGGASSELPAPEPEPALVGEEERPGAPTLPEFQQGGEDDFASDGE